MRYDPIDAAYLEAETFAMVFPDAKHQADLVLDQLEALNGDQQRYPSKDHPIYHRTNMIGHITASAFIFRPDTWEVLLIQHRALGKLIPPGGHVDPYERPVAAAVREALEETGITNLVPVVYHGQFACPIDIDTHGIPANAMKQEGSHRHHDYMYAFRATDTDLTPQVEEIDSAEWVPWRDLVSRGDIRTNRIAGRLWPFMLDIDDMKA